MWPLENSQKWFIKLVLLLFFVCIWLVCLGTDVIYVNVHHRSLGPEGNPLIYLHSSPFEQAKQRKIPREPTFLIILQVPIPLSAPPRCSHIIKNIAKLRDANEEKNKQKQITVRHVQTAKKQSSDKRAWSAKWRYVVVCLQGGRHLLMRHWQSLFPSVIYVRPLRCDSITPPSSALFKSFKKYLKSFFFVLWKRDDFTRSPGRQRERFAWPTALVRRCIVVRGDVTQGRGWEGGGALKENVLLYVMTAGWLDQSKAWSTQRGPCVRTCVCMHEGVWRLRLYTADTCSSGTKERGQCFVHNFNFRFLNVSNTAQNGM